MKYSQACPTHLYTGAWPKTEYTRQMWVDTSCLLFTKIFGAPLALAELNLSAPLPAQSQRGDNSIS